MMARRSLLELAALGTAATVPRAADPPFALPKLPYAYDALEPYIDTQTGKSTTKKHHQAYIDDLNTAVSTDPSISKLTVEELLQRLDSLPAGIRMQVRNQGGTGESGRSVGAGQWGTLLILYRLKAAK
jgi:Fe-Mn family superoxide dismutase